MIIFSATGFPLIVLFLIVFNYEYCYKRYIITSEYLQIDPSKVHEIEFLDERINTVLSQWSNADGEKEFTKLNKSINFFRKRYPKFIKDKLLSEYKFVKRCSKDLLKGRMKLNEGTVNEVYEKKPLADTNYSGRKWYNKF